MAKKKAGSSDAKKAFAAIEKAHKELELHIKKFKTVMGHGFVGSAAKGHPHGATGAQVKGHPFKAGAKVKGHSFKAGGKA
jgi:acetyl-CoA acetyltransferase